jgi:dihydrofolate synthase/folylpolyglutamate synthase
VAVVEAGLGGRLDSTNVLTPMVSVITNIGLEHTEILGKTITSISREKGGIIKWRVPCVTASEDKNAIRALGAIAHAKQSHLYHAARIVRYTPKKKPDIASFQSRSFSILDARLGLHGPHQVRNVRLAIAALEVLRKNPKLSFFRDGISNATIRRGVANVVKNTGLRGRLETIGRPPRYILDVAHNSPGMHILVETLGARGFGKLPVVFGVMQDKDYPSMVAKLATISSSIVAVAPAIKRARNGRMLYGYIRRQGIPVYYGGTVARGLKMAAKLARPVLVTGSHYVVGEALKILIRKKA